MAAWKLLSALLVPLLASGSPVTTHPSGRDVYLDEASQLKMSTNLAATSLKTGLEASSKRNLPVFFFHGITGDRTNAVNIEANLTAEGRPFVALGFCEK